MMARAAVRMTVSEIVAGRFQLNREQLRVAGADDGVFIARAEDGIGQGKRIVPPGWETENKRKLKLFSHFPHPRL